MAAVARRRPVFHSEADCQHELALEIHQAGHQVRLEVPRDVQVNGATVRAEIDLLVKETTWTAIELKYVRQAATIKHGGESFDLAGTWGTNLSRFDCLADLRRVEAIVKAGHARQGYAVFLTNATSAWRDDVSATANMARDFSIHEGRRLPRGRPLDWDPPTPPVASVSRKRLSPFAPILLDRAQDCNWRDYSKLHHPAGVFRYLLLSA